MEIILMVLVGFVCLELGFVFGMLKAEAKNEKIIKEITDMVSHLEENAKKIYVSNPNPNDFNETT